MKNGFLDAEPDRGCSDTMNSRAASKSKWVWHSTPASIEQRQISALAVLEIGVSIGAFWWLAFHNPWPWMTLLAFLACPLLLLRSPESVATGLQRLQAYWYRDRQSVPKTQFWGVSGLSAVIAGILVYLLASRWLPGHSGWALWWRSAMSGAIPVLSAFALVIAVIGLVAVAGGRAFTFAFTGAIAGAGLVTFPFLPLIALGIFGRTVWLRISATLSHLRSGIRSYGSNCREVFFCIDVCHTPEIMPGANQIAELNPLTHVQGPASRGLLESALFFIFGAMLYLVIWIPALLYRMNLKANFWLWLLLAQLLEMPDDSAAAEPERRYRVSVISKGYWAGKRGWGAFAVGLWLLLPWLDQQQQKLAANFDLAKSALTVSTAFAPPPAGSLRYVLLWICVGLIFYLHKTSVDYRAAYAKPAEAGKDYDDQNINPLNMAHLKVKMRFLERLNDATFVALVLTVWVMALWGFQTYWPQDAKYAAWEWLQPWL